MTKSIVPTDEQLAEKQALIDEFRSKNEGLSKMLEGERSQY